MRQLPLRSSQNARAARKPTANSSAGNVARVLAQSGIVASLTHVQDFSCTKTTLSAIENWFKQHEEVMQVHAAFAEQNPRGHAGMQARSVVLVTHALMNLRCLKDVAPRDQKVTETLSVFGICPGSHGNDDRVDSLVLRCQRCRLVRADA